MAYTPTLQGCLLVSGDICDKDGNNISYDEYGSKGKILRIYTEEFDVDISPDGFVGDEIISNSPADVTVHAIAPGVELAALDQTISYEVLPHTSDGQSSPIYNKSLTLPEVIAPRDSEVVARIFYGEKILITPAVPESAPDAGDGSPAVYGPDPENHHEIIRVMHNFGGNTKHSFSEEEASNRDKKGYVRQNKAYLSYANGSAPTVYQRVTPEQGVSYALRLLAKDKFLARYPNVDTIFIDSHTENVMRKFPLSSYNLSEADFKELVGRYSNIKFSNSFMTLPLYSGTMTLDSLVVDTANIVVNKQAVLDVKELEIVNCTFNAAENADGTVVTIKTNTTTEFIFNTISSLMHFNFINDNPAEKKNIVITGLTLDFGSEKKDLESILRFNNIDNISILDVKKNKDITDTNIIKATNGSGISISDFVDNSNVTNKSLFVLDGFTKMKFSGLKYSNSDENVTAITVNKSRVQSEILFLECDVKVGTLIKIFGSNVKKMTIIDSVMSLSNLNKGLNNIINKISFMTSKVDVKNDINLNTDNLIIDDAVVSSQRSITSIFSNNFNVSKGTLKASDKLSIQASGQKSNFNSEGGLFGGTSVLVESTYEVLDSENKSRMDINTTRFTADDIEITKFSTISSKFGRLEAKNIILSSIPKIRSFVTDILSLTTKSIKILDSSLVKTLFYISDKGGHPKFELTNCDGNIIIEDDIKTSKTGNIGISIVDSKVLCEIRNKTEVLSNVTVCSTNSLSSAVGYDANYNVSLIISPTCPDYEKIEKIDITTFKRNKVGKDMDEKLYYGIIEDVNDKTEE